MTRGQRKNLLLLFLEVQYIPYIHTELEALGLIGFLVAKNRVLQLFRTCKTYIFTLTKNDTLQELEITPYNYYKLQSATGSMGISQKSIL